MLAKLKRPAIFLLIAVIGAPLGYFARGAMEPAKDRAAAMISLFATYCLPMAQTQQPPAPNDLLPLNVLPHMPEWIDPASKLLLGLDPQRCGVSDELMQFNAAERLAVAAAVPNLIESKLPGFKPSPPVFSVESWDLFLIWADSNRHDAKRATVTFTRFAKAGDTAATGLNLRVPAN